MTDHMYEAWTDGASSLDKYEGATDHYTVETVRAERYGKRALRSDGSYARIDRPEADGPRRGETFAKSTFPAAGEDETARFSVLFGEPDDPTDGGYDGYVVLADHARGVLRLGIRNRGTYTWPDDASAAFDPTGTDGSWNDIHVDYGHTNEETIEARYVDTDGSLLASVTLEDDTFDGGGWGFAVWSASGESPAGWVDYFRDTTPDGGDDDRGTDDEPAPPAAVYVTSRSDTTVTVGWDHSPDYGGGDSA